MLAFISKGMVKFSGISSAHGGCMCNVCVGVHAQYVHGGCTHNAHVGGACAMRMWGCMQNARVGGAHAMHA